MTFPQQWECVEHVPTMFSASRCGATRKAYEGATGTDKARLGVKLKALDIPLGGVIIFNLELGIAIVHRNPKDANAPIDRMSWNGDAWQVSA